MNRREWFPVLLPTNNWLGAWNLFMLFGVLVITVWGPFDIAFVLVRCVATPPVATNGTGSPEPLPASVELGLEKNVLWCCQ